MATTSSARTSIAISANPGNETVQTLQNAEIDREAARTWPEVRQGSQGLVSRGLEEGALVLRDVLRISQPTQPPQVPHSGRQQLRSTSRLHREASHRKARLGIMTHRVMSLLQLVPQKTVINGDYYRMSILTKESLDAINRTAQEGGVLQRSLVADTSQVAFMQDEFSSHTTDNPKEAAIVSGEPLRILGEEECGQGTARTSI